MVEHPVGSERDTSIYDTFSLPTESPMANLPSNIAPRRKCLPTSSRSHCREHHFAPSAIGWWILILMSIPSRITGVCWAKRKVNHGQTMAGHEFPPRRREINQRPETKQQNGHIRATLTGTICKFYTWWAASKWPEFWYAGSKSHFCKFNG